MFLNMRDAPFPIKQVSLEFPEDFPRLVKAPVLNNGFATVFARFVAAKLGVIEVSGEAATQKELLSPQ